MNALMRIFPERRLLVAADAAQAPIGQIPRAPLAALRRRGFHDKKNALSGGN